MLICRRNSSGERLDGSVVQSVGEAGCCCCCCCSVLLLHVPVVLPSLASALCSSSGEGGGVIRLVKMLSGRREMALFEALILCNVRAMRIATGMAA